MLGTYLSISIPWGQHTGNNASFDSFETLVKEHDEFRLLLREPLLVLRDDPQLNKYVKSIPLELFS